MKKLTATILILIATLASLTYGAYSERMAGAVRTRSTGFYLNEGENIAIGTSTPTLADVHIWRTATSTLVLDGLLGCVGIREKTGPITYYISSGGELATTTAAACGF